VLSAHVRESRAARDRAGDAERDPSRRSRRAEVSTGRFEVDGEYPLDFLGYLEPIGTVDDLLPHAETVSIGGHPTRVIGLDDLIRIKRYIGRPTDRESLLHLEAIKRLREQEGLR
jgi:predicted nucleotidyltransferase